MLIKFWLGSKKTLTLPRPQDQATNLKLQTLILRVEFLRFVELVVADHHQSGAENPLKPFDVEAIVTSHGKDALSVDAAYSSIDKNDV